MLFRIVRCSIASWANHISSITFQVSGVAAHIIFNEQTISNPSSSNNHLMTNESSLPLTRHRISNPIDSCAHSFFLHFSWTQSIFIFLFRFPLATNINRFHAASVNSARKWDEQHKKNSYKMNGDERKTNGKKKLEMKTTAMHKQ